MPAIVVYLQAVALVMWFGWAYQARYRDVLLSLLFMRNLAGTDMLTTHIWSALHRTTVLSVLAVFVHLVAASADALGRL